MHVDGVAVGEVSRVRAQVSAFRRVHNRVTGKSEESFGGRSEDENAKWSKDVGLSGGGQSRVSPLFGSAWDRVLDL